MANFSTNTQVYGYSLKGCWLSAIGYRLLAIGCRLLAVGCWLLAVGRWSLTIRYLLFARKLTTILLLLTSYLLLPTSLNAQNKKAIELLDKSKKAFVEKKYEQSSKWADDVLKLDTTIADAYYLKAQLYEVFTQPDEAINYYEKTIALAPQNTAFGMAYQKLINHHLQAGNYSKTKQFSENYSKLLKPNSIAHKRALRQIEICNYAEKAMKNALKIEPEEMSDTVNRFILQYFPSPTADNETLIFTAITPQGDEDLYVSTFQKGTWQEAKPISDKINTADNEGTGTLSADGRTLVFTSCNRKDGYGGCDLYISYKNGEEWTRPKNLGAVINTFNWESQPSLSPDGRTLYFVSDRIGGAGGRDIWYSILDKNKQWTAAQNLGNIVNTMYDEASPFIHANSRTLVFASEGHDNFGGYDLFMTDSTATGWQPPQNLGYPINTSDNQIALAITSDARYGYYSFDTKRIGNQRVSKIYRFALPDDLRKKLNVANYLKGTITDTKTHKAIKADIELINLRTNKTVAKFESDAISGQYTTILPNGSDWGVYVSAKGYFYKSLSFDFSEKNKAEGKTLNITLDPLDFVGTSVLSNIYFETGKAELQEKSRSELDKLAQTLKNQTILNIEIDGHTDDVGDAKQNLALSQKRAQSVVDYLVQLGVEKERIKAVGFGKTRPRVPNTNDENRSLNRRIEWRLWQKN